MLAVIISCWQNYGQFSFFYAIFIFYIFYHKELSYLEKEKKSVEEVGKSTHIPWVSHPYHFATPSKLTSIYWVPTKGPAQPQPL